MSNNVTLLRIYELSRFTQYIGNFKFLSYVQYTLG